ncbi:MAG: hypothetical protein ISS78_11610 [Phycisphaerae bacterium]|nr:hypothetical protein [Phycisphaerae bacterium]
MRSSLSIVTIALVSSVVLAGGAMVDPAIDAPDKPWCYLAKSTTVIGTPYMPGAVQVTFDGAIYTQSAELCFFYGKGLRPVFARQKTWLDGWIPIVQYAWRDGPIAYDIEMFGAPLDGEDETNTVQFARMTMRNTSKTQADGRIAAAMRHNGGDRRAGGTTFSPDWTYAMTDRGVWRNGCLVYVFTPGARLEATPGQAYEKPFVGRRRCITPRSAVGMVRFERTLKPGESFSATFTMPRTPVPRSENALVEKVRQARYDRYRRKTEQTWRDMFAAGSQFDIPEQRVHEAVRASLVHLMLATRQRGGKRFQTSGLPYQNFFMIDYVDMRAAYDAMGRGAFARQSFEQVFDRQQDDGLFCDTSLSHGKRLWSSHGHMVHSLAHHCLMTRDWAYARTIRPKLLRAVQWIDAASKQDKYGLMPPAWPYDAEMIKGRYTSHNLWSLLGLRSAVRLAGRAGWKNEAELWRKLHDDYEASVLKAIDATAGRDRYVPTGLYDFITGPAARRGFAEYRTNQDWENLLLSYPTEVLAPGDGRLAATLAMMHRIRYREGIMTYRNGMHLHQYLTTNVTNQHVVRGEQRQALIDLYHVLLHSGSTHEGYENMVVPWSTRDTNCPPPHAWAAAKITLLIRNMLVLEHGGRAGLNADKRDLHLFSVVSPAWAGRGKKIAIRDARTEMGPVNAVMTFTDDGASVTLNNRFHTPPRSLVVRVPYFVELVRFDSDAKQARRDGDRIVLSPDATRLTMKFTPRPKAHDGRFQDLLLAYRREVGHWKGKIDDHPAPPKGFLTAAEQAVGGEPISFDLVLRAYQHEYKRRFDAHVKAGGAVMTVAAPPLLSDEQRRAAFTKQFGRVASTPPGIAVGKPATASASLDRYSRTKRQRPLREVPQRTLLIDVMRIDVCVFVDTPQDGACGRCAASVVPRRRDSSHISEVLLPEKDRRRSATSQSGRSSPHSKGMSIATDRRPTLTRASNLPALSAAATPVAATIRTATPVRMLFVRMSSALSLNALWSCPSLEHRITLEPTQ